jgi:pimeloyl-ACP methyl ester carboxylesterase
MTTLLRPLLTMLEARAGLEAGTTVLALPLLSRAAVGDGHPILLLPGFGAGDVSMEPLRWFLSGRGYHVETWGLGRNRGFNRRFTNVIEQKVRHLHHKHRRKVSLVGWSLGGVFAFYAAHVAPECVRSVISLGSPLRLDPDSRVPPGVAAMYRAISGNVGPVAHQARARSRHLRAPPPVPSTCIYSVNDGFVPPAQATLDGNAADHENVCVSASHLGLGFNSLVLWIVADRLAQHEGHWAPFRASGAMAPVLRTLGLRAARD